MSDIYSTKPGAIYNVWAKHPDDIMNDSSAAGIFSMVPHFFYEFNHDPNARLIYAGPVNGRTGKNIADWPVGKIREYMEKIGNDNTKFIFDNLYEGSIHTIIDIIYRALVGSKIRASQCYYFSGAMDSNELHDQYCEQNKITNRISVYSCNTWEYSLKKESYHNDVPYEIKKRDKTLVCFNRMLRSHRLALVALMHERNLIKDSYYSFFPNAAYNISDELTEWLMKHISDYSSKDIYDRIVENYKVLGPQLPLQLNIEWEENANYVKADDLEYFQNSYFSLVTETFFFPLPAERRLVDGQAVFFSEKIYKPIIMRHPFILMSRPRSLAMLRKIGYKTFSPMIDESYDEIENDGDRLDAIVTEAARLNSFTDEQWLEWQTKIKSIVDYNHSVLTYREKHMYVFTRPDHENQY